MALFGSPRAILGLDIGTASLKVVELIDRHKRLEVATYGQADVSNPLLDPNINEDIAIAQLSGVITQLLDKASVSTDAVVAALPSSIVFSTVIDLPNIPEQDMDKAVQFAARDVVPANIEDMILGWSRLGELPHLTTQPTTTASQTTEATPAATPVVKPTTAPTVPVFITAAPKDIVNRYTKLLQQLKLELVALEVETFSLVRSLLEPNDSALIVDIGDQLTTFHLIDGGTARVSNTSEIGGYDITQALAADLHVSDATAESTKVTYGLDEAADPKVHNVVENLTEQLLQQAQQILSMYNSQTGHTINKTILIGGGANLKGLARTWEKLIGHKTVVGNPWQGLAFPQELENRLQEIGPTYAVAVGLARRGFNNV